MGWGVWRWGWAGLGVVSLWGGGVKRWGCLDKVGMRFSSVKLIGQVMHGGLIGWRVVKE